MQHNFTKIPSFKILASLLLISTMLFFSGCFVFKKKCDCPSFGKMKEMPAKPVPVSG